MKIEAREIPDRWMASKKNWASIACGNYFGRFKTKRAAEEYAEFRYNRCQLRMKGAK